MLDFSTSVQNQACILGHLTWVTHQVHPVCHLWLDKHEANYKQLTSLQTHGSKKTLVMTPYGEPPLPSRYI